MHGQHNMKFEKNYNLLGCIWKSAKVFVLLQITLFHNLQHFIRKSCTPRTLKCLILLRLSMKILLSFLTSLHPLPPNVEVANGWQPTPPSLLSASTGISRGDLLTSLICAKSHT